MGCSNNLLWILLIAIIVIVIIVLVVNASNDTSNETMQKPIVGNTVGKAVVDLDKSKKRDTKFHTIKNELALVPVEPKYRTNCGCKTPCPIDIPCPCGNSCQCPPVNCNVCGPCNCPPVPRCGGGIGDKCAVNSQCASGLSCDLNGTCSCVTPGIVTGITANVTGLNELVISWNVTPGADSYTIILNGPSSEISTLFCGN